MRIAPRRVLVVERFDSLPQANGRITRRPQKDFCQALAVPGPQKYETDGSPAIAALMRMLATGAAPVTDRQMYLCARIVFGLLVATDGHAPPPSSTSAAAPPVSRGTMTSSPRDTRSVAVSVS